MPDMNPQQTEAPDDLRNSLVEQFAAADAAADTPEPDAGTTVPPPASDTPEALVSPPDASGERPRDASGKFLPKAEAKPIQTEAAPDAPVKETPSTDTAKASTEPASTPAVAPPAGWTAAEKAEWSKLPPAVQTAVSRREAEISRGGQQWSDEKRRYEAALAPVAQAAASRGMRTEEGLKALVAAQDFLDRDPVSAIKWLAQNHGVNLATLAGQPADSSREPQQPDISALVRQHIAPILAPIQERLQMEDRQRETSTVNLVTEFASSPGHEHFENVSNEIMAMIPQIRTMNPAWTHDKVLQDAYDRAVWANPTTRAAMTDAQFKATEEKRQADAKARTTAARSASVSVTGAPVGTNGSAPKGSIREELEAAFAGR